MHKKKIELGSKCIEPKPSIKHISLDANRRVLNSLIKGVILYQTIQFININPPNSIIADKVFNDKTRRGLQLNRQVNLEQIRDYIGIGMISKAIEKILQPQLPNIKPEQN